eukprot:TRINITY_DN37152_c0_g3_i1.p1 TRINITY_DN37152_c0_g3~~TRINITY_DN37152_c0_g3_i1.p1  ORF type:complete len:660 (+),score=179.40 TRINITY_DN37152_c0_g3_i1:68-2047(+)
MLRFESPEDDGAALERRKPRGSVMSAAARTSKAAGAGEEEWGGAVVHRRTSLTSTCSRYSTYSKASKVQKEARDKDKKDKKKSIYPNMEDIKEQVLESVMVQGLDDFKGMYKKHGIWQKMARHALFEQVTLAVIALNAIWIAVDTDHNHSDLLLEAHWVFQLAENLFCFFFSFEYFVRAMAFRRIYLGIYDSWFVFDGIMCGLMIAETWVFMSLLLVMGEKADIGASNTGSGSDLLKTARLLRLSRMMRMVRLMKAVPELLIMSKGLIAAFRPVFFTLVLIGSIVLVFAIAFTQLTAGYKLHDRYFSSILNSSYFLLVHGALLLSTDLKAPEIYAEGGFLLNVFFFTFVLLTSVLLMNMLIGVLCEVVIIVSSTEKERFLVTFVKDRLEEVVALIDEDGGGTISRDEFMLIMDNESAVQAMDEVGVDVIGLLDFADFIFGEEGGEGSECGSEGSASSDVELTLKDFLEVILQLRGSNQATVKDFVDVRKTVNSIFDGQFKKLDSMNEKVRNLTLQLDQTTTAMIENRERLMPGEYLCTTGEAGPAILFEDDVTGEQLTSNLEDVNSTMAATEDAEDEPEPEDEVVWQSGGSSPAVTVYSKDSELEEAEEEPRPNFIKGSSTMSLRPELVNKKLVQAGQKFVTQVSWIMQKVKSNPRSES